MKLYQRGNIWWVTYGTKPQRRVSTGKTDKREAENVAMRIIAPAMTDNEAALVEKIVQMRRDAVTHRADVIPLDKVFDGKRYQMRHGVKDSSVKSAGDYWRLFVAFCRRRGINTVEELDTDVCASYIATKGNRSAQCASIYCRQILRDIGCNRELFHIVKKKGEATHREPLTPDQIRMMFEIIDGMASRRPYNSEVDAVEFAWYVRMLIYSGLRIGDAARMTMEMYNPESGSIKKVMDKTSRTVEFPLHTAMIPYMERRIADGASPGDYVFPEIARLRPYSITSKFKRIFRRLDIKGKPGQYCAHCLRTTFASLCAENGVPLAVIQSWLGHTSPMITRIYARIEDMKRKREALARFPDLG